MISILAFLAAGVSAGRADTAITSWDLTTAVLDFSGVEPSISGQSFETVLNPLGIEQHGFLPASPPYLHTANTYYDASWLVDANTGHFDVAFDQQVNGPDSFASTSGFIYLNTSVDLLMDLSGMLTFSSSAADEALFGAGLLVQQQGQPTPLFNQSVRGGTGSFGLPASGSVGFTREDLLLPAGQTYLIQFAARTDMGLLPQPYQPLLASGTLHFDWSPVPEPATLVSLASAALLLRARRGNRARPRRQSTPRD